MIVLKLRVKSAAVFSDLNFNATAAYSETVIILKTLSFRQKMDLSPLGAIYMSFIDGKKKL